MKQLLDLINKNPNLPVFPIIYNSFVDWFDDNPFCDSTVGNIGNALILNYCEVVENGIKRIILEWDESVCDIENPEWKEGIFFYINSGN